NMAGVARLPAAAVLVHEADLSAIRSWEGMVSALGVDEEHVAEMLSMFQQDFHYAPRPDAVGYADGHVWELGDVRVRAIHMPGHTAGHTALLVEPEGVVFIGDIDLTGFGPYYGDASSSLSDFRRSLARLPDIPAKTWVTAHHRGVYTDRERFLHDLSVYEARLVEREQRLLELLRAAPRTLEELAASRVLYPRDFEAVWVTGIERRTISYHLA